MGLSIRWRLTLWNTSTLAVLLIALGAMVYGGVQVERLQLNEDTLWEGYKRDGANSNALAALSWTPDVLPWPGASGQEPATSSFSRSGPGASRPAS